MLSIEDLQVKAIIHFLLNTRAKKGYFLTPWGKKTTEGLHASILRIFRGDLEIKDCENIIAF